MINNPTIPAVITEGFPVDGKAGLETEVGDWLTVAVAINVGVGEIMGVIVGVKERSAAYTIKDCVIVFKIPVESFAVTVIV